MLHIIKTNNISLLKKLEHRVKTYNDQYSQEKSQYHSNFCCDTRIVFPINPVAA